MTVPTSDNREEYLGNGSTTVFDYAFKIFRDEDLDVYLVEGDSQTLQALGTDYTVSGAGSTSGGSITMTTAPTSSQTLVILRIIAVTQETDLRNQGDYYPETVEDEMDRSRMIDQQQEDKIARSLQRPEALNYWDAENRNIRNVKDAVELDDAVSKGQMDTRFSNDVITKTSSHWDGKGLQVRNFAVRSPVQDGDLPNMGAVKAYFTALESGELGDTSKVTAEGTTDQRALMAWMKALGYPTSSTGTDQPLATALDQRWIHFAAVADMSGAANLAVGDRVRTSGYSASGGGGGNAYEIVAAATGTADGGSFINLTASGLQAKGLFLSGQVSVKQFGASGDGLTDDSSAFTAALSAADAVIVPQGEFLISEISIPDDKSLTGEGVGATVLKKAATGRVISSLGRRSTISKMTIDGNATSFSGSSVEISVGENSATVSQQGHQLISRVRFRNSTDYHVKYTAANKGWQSKISLCRFDEPTVADAAVLWPDEDALGGNRTVERCYSACPLVNLNGCDNGHIVGNIVGVGSKGGEQGILTPSGTTYSSKKVIIHGNRFGIADAALTLRGVNHVITENVCAATVTLTGSFSGSLFSGNITTQPIDDQLPLNSTTDVYHTDTYSPTFRSTGGDASLGNGTARGAISYRGREKYVKGKIIFGSTTVFGSGSFVSDVEGLDLSSETSIGSWQAFDANTSNAWPGVSFITANGNSVQFSDGVNRVNSGYPMTWASGDLLQWEVRMR